MHSTPPGKDFWTFAVALYHRPGVKQACLTLQESQGNNVPLLLWCVWRGARGERIAAPVMRKACALSEEYARALVRPLRAMRNDLKPPRALLGEAASNAARAKVLALELEMERAQMDALAALGAGAAGAPCCAMARANIRLRRAVTGGRGGGRALAVILRAAFTTG